MTPGVAQGTMLGVFWSKPLVGRELHLLLRVVTKEDPCRVKSCHEQVKQSLQFRVRVVSTLCFPFEPHFDNQNFERLSRVSGMKDTVRP